MRRTLSPSKHPSNLVQSYHHISTPKETLNDNNERARMLEDESGPRERDGHIRTEDGETTQTLKEGRLVAMSAVAAELFGVSYGAYGPCVLPSIQCYLLRVPRLMEESSASFGAKWPAEAEQKQSEYEILDLSTNLFSTTRETLATKRQVRAQAEESLVSL
jgi:hypothetical protein